MKLCWKNSPAPVLEHSSGEAIAGTDIQCDTGLEAGRNQFHGTADALAHIIGEQFSRCGRSSDAGYQLEFEAGAG